MDTAAVLRGPVGAAVRRAPGRRWRVTVRPQRIGGAQLPGRWEAIAARQEHSEVYPLLLFSLGGMMAFVSANDLITMFVALEVLSFPLLRAGRNGQASAAAQPGGVAEVLPAGCAQLGDLPVRHRHAVRLRGLVPLPRHRHRHPGRRSVAVAAGGRAGPGHGGPAVQDRRGAVPRLGARRLRRLAHRRHRVHGDLHQGRRRGRHAAAALRRARRTALGLAVGDRDRRGGHHGDPVRWSA